MVMIICPIMTAGKMANSEIESHWVQCQQEGCAWWNAEAEGCGIVARLNTPPDDCDEDYEEGPEGSGGSFRVL